MIDPPTRMEIAVAFTLPKLPYAYDALEPHIDAQTMEIHHTKHHQTYVNNANAALEGTEWADRPVEEVIANLDALPEDKRGPLRNNAGGHANHSLFWTVMSPDGGGNPVGEVAKRIDSDLGGLDKLKADFAAASTASFGASAGTVTVPRTFPFTWITNSTLFPVPVLVTATPSSVTDCNVRPAGRTSATFTLVAALGPLLTNCSV